MLGIDVFLHPKRFIKVFFLSFFCALPKNNFGNKNFSVSLSEMFPSKLFLKNDNFGGVIGNIVSGLFWS